MFKFFVFVLLCDRFILRKFFLGFIRGFIVDYGVFFLVVLWIFVLYVFCVFVFEGIFRCLFSLNLWFFVVIRYWIIFFVRIDMFEVVIFCFCVVIMYVLKKFRMFCILMLCSIL